MLEPMQFTEHELTAALTGATKTVLAGSAAMYVGKADIDTVWNQLSQHQRFQVLDGLGGQVLPVLVALPDIEVEPGSRPTFTDRQVTETGESLVEDRLGRVRRAMVVNARTALVQSALAHVPPRQDPRRAGGAGPPVTSDRPATQAGGAATPRIEPATSADRNKTHNPGQFGARTVASGLG